MTEPTDSQARAVPVAANGNTHPLEPGESEMRAMLASVTERIIGHIRSLPQQPAHGTEGAVAVARQHREPMPEHGAELEALLSLLFDEAAPRSFNTAGPGYLAYIPGGGLFDSAVASLIADPVNRCVGVFAAAPVLAPP